MLAQWSIAVFFITCPIRQWTAYPMRNKDPIYPNVKIIIPMRN